MTTQRPGFKGVLGSPEPFLEYLWYAQEHRPEEREYAEGLPLLRELSPYPPMQGQKPTGSHCTACLEAKGRSSWIGHLWASEDPERCHSLRLSAAAAQITRLEVKRSGLSKETPHKTSALELELNCESSRLACPEALGSVPSTQTRHGDTCQ